MIYTVTFNPSLDYVIQTEELVPGRINRTTHECIYPGGKGNNVSVILSNLGLKTTKRKQRSSMIIWIRANSSKEQ